MILLDTNALLYLLGGHPRAKRLAPHAGKLALSPLSLLELRFLEEAGRGRFVGRAPMAAVRNDSRFRVDDPPLLEVVEHAMALTWTRDPFDRLLVGHALARGWPIATSDTVILEHLPASRLVEL